MFIKYLYVLLLLCLAITLENKSMEQSTFSAKQLQESDEYKTFKTLQKIIKVTQQVKTQIPKEGPNSFYDYERLERPFWWKFQTKGGLFLIINGVPTNIASPWGSIDLGRNYGCSGHGTSLVNYAFFKRIKAVFYGLCGVNGIDDLSKIVSSVPFLKFYETTISQEGAITLKEVPNDKLHTYLGKDAILDSNNCNIGTVYKICAVDDEILPWDPVFLSLHERRSEEEIDAFWKAMILLYQSESLTKLSK